MKDKKPSNMSIAIYIANKHGHNVPDNKLIEVANAYGLKAAVLIKNYKSVVSINEICDSLKNISENT